MTVPSWSRLGAGVVGCLALDRFQEEVLGDLAEEAVIRSRSCSRLSVSWWYWRQVAFSIPPLFMVGLKQKGRLAVFGVALSAYLIASVVEFAAGIAISALFAVTSNARLFIELIVGLTTLTAAGYLATSVRRGSAGILAGIVIVVVVLLIMSVPESAPLWYAMVFLTVGPIASIVGGVWCVTRSFDQSPRSDY